MLKKEDPKVSGTIRDGGGAWSESREGGTRRNFGWKQHSSHAASRGAFCKGFRQVKLIVEGKLPQREVSRRLNVSENTLQNWLKAYRQGKVSEVGKNYREMSETELE
ncbi:MAG TPA: transposase, partial [Dissulfurispiraceae bacterium]|nr:transposase [Dissulfurispiraceae bacterium]